MFKLFYAYILNKVTFTLGPCFHSDRLHDFVLCITRSSWSNLSHCERDIGVKSNEVLEVTLCVCDQNVLMYHTYEK